MSEISINKNVYQPKNNGFSILSKNIREELIKKITLNVPFFIKSSGEKFTLLTSSEEVLKERIAKGFFSPIYINQEGIVNIYSQLANKYFEEKGLEVTEEKQNKIKEITFDWAQKESFDLKTIKEFEEGLKNF